MKHILLAGAFLLSTAGLHAGFYLGASITSTASDFETAVESVDADEMGWKAFGGFRFLDFLGAEVGYRDLGHFNEGTTGASIDLDVKALDGSVRLFFPIAMFDFFARAGFANVSWDGSISIEDEVENFDEDEWDLFYGVGVELNLGPEFAIRAEWERFEVSDSLNTLSAGVVYRF